MRGTPSGEFRARTVALLAAAVLLVTAPAAAARPHGPLHSSGRWIVDRSGRVVIFHGTNLVPPGPPGTPRHYGIGRRHLAFLARQGFRLIRLGTFYANVEPGPGRFSAAHLTAFARYARAVARSGMWTMPDFHQDLYNAKFLGRGFPDWMVIDDGAPNQPNPGFPGGYFVDPALERAYDNFWADIAGPGVTGIQTQFARGWRRTATRLAAVPRVLGYDIFNEPWPGTAWPGCANPAGCPPGGFDQTTLTSFSRRIANSIRSGDPHRIVFAEPNLMFDVGAATGLGDIGDRNAGLSFHDYCLGAAPGLPQIPDPAQSCRTGEQLTLDNAEAYARRTGAALVLSEFSDTKDPAVSRRITDLADAAMVSWTFWSYWAANGQIVKDPTRPPVASNLEQPLLDAIVRPYPYIVAGTPLRYGFDRATRVFRLSFDTAPVAAVSSAAARRPDSRVSEVIVPRRVYPGGRYVVSVSGARVVSHPGAADLRLRTAPGSGKVRVVVRPRRRSRRGG